MKAGFLLLLICQLFVFNKLTSNSFSQPLTNIVVDEEGDPIDCKGNLPPNTPIRGKLATPALAAWLNPYDIQVNFNYEVGSVDIEIVDAGGQTVYVDSVDSQEGEIIIPITGFAPGAYTITFTNSTGTMWGDFTL